MYEKYSTQALPDRKYRELLGTALCVFNSNNAFVIENLLNIRNKYNISDEHDWWNLIDQYSGNIEGIMKGKKYKNTFRENKQLLQLWHNLILSRNRIIHSYQVTSRKESDDVNGQILYTKIKGCGEQFPIDKKYLMNFIKANSKFSGLLQNLRDRLSN